MAKSRFEKQPFLQPARFYLSPLRPKSRSSCEPGVGISRQTKINVKMHFVKNMISKKKPASQQGSEGHFTCIFTVFSLCCTVVQGCIYLGGGPLAQERPKRHETLYFAMFSCVCINAKKCFATGSQDPKVRFVGVSRGPGGTQKT